MGCTSGIDNNNVLKMDFQIENRTYIDYFEGEELNSLVFGKEKYTYHNVEMETIETGTYEVDSTSKICILRRSQVEYPSGETEEDKTIFILKFPNDTTLVYTKRISYNEQLQIQDTTLLDPFPMYLKQK